MHGKGLGIRVDICTHIAVDPSHGTNPVLRGVQNVHVAHGDWPMESGTQLQLRRLKSRARLSDGSADDSSPWLRPLLRTPGPLVRLAGRALRPCSPPATCQAERFNVSGGYGEVMVSEPGGYQSGGVCPTPGDCTPTGTSCSPCYPDGGCLNTCTSGPNWFIESSTCPGSSSGTKGNYPPGGGSHASSHVLVICRDP